MAARLRLVLETSGRLLRLLSLLQARREWRGEELADRLDVTPRTIRRDVDKLRALGYPVDATRGVAGGYRLGAGAELPPLLLDDEEAVAIAVALRTAAGGTVAGIEESAVRALAKLQQVLPGRLRRRVGALDAFTAALPGTGPVVDHELLAALAAAARDRERLRFHYRRRPDGDADADVERRLVEPVRLVHLATRWYLVAWDVDRDDWRTFRVDRIDGAPRAERRFEPRDPPAEDVAAWVQERVVRIKSRRQARVLLHAPLEDVVREVPRLHALLSPAGPDRCVLEMSADWLGGLALYVAELRVPYEVLEPPELVDELDRLAGAIADAVARTRARGDGGGDGAAVAGS